MRKTHNKDLKFKVALEAIWDDLRIAQKMAYNEGLYNICIKRGS
jgi:hypothetical protein